MASSDNKKRTYWRHLELVIAIVISAVLLLLIGSPVALGYYFKDKFYPGTTVAGVKVSQKTLGEATQMLDNKFGKIEKKQLTLNIVNQPFESDLTKLGVKFDWQTVLNKTYQQQHTNNFKNNSLGLAKAIWGKADNKVAVPLTIDKKSVETYLDEILAKVNKNPTDAAIRVDNNQIVIDKEVNGVGVDKTTLESLIYKNLMAKANQGGWTKLNLTFQATDLQPKVTESSLAAAKTQAENMTKNPITMTFEDKTFTASQQDMIKWLKFETKDNVVTPVIDKGQVDKYVAGIAKKIDVIAITKKISSVDGGVLQEGKDGRSLAKSKLTDDIINVINQAQASQQQPTTQASPTDGSATAQAATTTTTPNFTIAMQVDVKPFSTVTAAPPFTPGMYPGKYIEVNLTEQKMYLWDGTNKVAEYRVSTGKKSTPTPEGTFSIYNKAPVGKYFPWIMPWWMGVHNGVGIHELPVDMRTGRKEGINDIGFAVSHGCIRLAVGEAKQVYDFGEVGMPVYIHK